MVTPDQDSPWKDLLDRFFEAFMAFFFPAAHAQIDWARGYEFLDKELQKLTADAALGRRAVDKLVKVWLKSGEDVVALIHAEVQGQREQAFAERIYVYHHRLSDRFNQRVATFVILTDGQRRWRPRAFQYELLGTTLRLQFSVVKLLDYQTRWAELEQSANPFAIVVMAHLRMLEARRAPQQRLADKLELTKLLYDRGYDELTIIGLFRFLDWLMFLPADLQHEYRDEIDRFEEERKMPYVTTIERMGIAKGVQTGGGEILLNLLQLRLGELGTETKTQLLALPFERIRELSLLELKSVDELQAWLRAHQEQPLTN
ncbi:MAG: hypothetical protein HYR56_12130 [Acidobacteria bacterium]|nr:hypothetical protein [Acidobacteriota bacterium]MBI3428264.1 hypothetical protein [Acidobacteriota bacterium]